MTADELMQAQMKLGLTNEALGRLCGRSGVTVYYWRAGLVPVPVYVERILQGATITDAGVVISPYEAK